MEIRVEKDCVIKKSLRKERKQKRKPTVKIITGRGLFLGNGGG
jgi:hypothetical protein